MSASTKLTDEQVAAIGKKMTEDTEALCERFLAIVADDAPPPIVIGAAIGVIDAAFLMADVTLRKHIIERLRLVPDALVEMGDWYEREEAQKQLETAPSAGSGVH